MIHFLVPRAGAYTLDEYFSLEPPELVRRFRVIPYEALPRQHRFERGTYVLAGLDQLTPGMERLVGVLHQRLRGEAGIRILNDPARAMGRYDLLRALHRAGRNEFRAYRLDEDLRGMRYPVFLRGERSHEGNFSALLHSLAEVERAAGLTMVQGHPRGDLLVIEFCSTVHPDGLYRKYAAFNVGGRILARSLNHSGGWMVKFAESEFTRELVLEEQAYVRDNPHAGELTEIFRLAGIEYGQIDYSFKEGRIQTWEINLHATIGRGAGPGGGAGPAELRPLRSQTREMFFDRFREAWAAVDLDSGGLPLIEVGFAPEVLRAAATRRIRLGRALELLRQVLRPVKPVLRPLTRPLIRLLGILARRRPTRRS